MGDSPGVKVAESSAPTIDLIGEKSFAFSGDAHHVVTFLNRTLKYRDLIFGLTLNPDGTYSLRIYETKNCG